VRLKLPSSKYDFSFITNNSDECNKDTAFLLTSLNKKYLSIAKQKTNYIICAEDLNKYIPLNIKTIGITGTNGKTTITYIISFILNSLGHKTATIGTMGFFINNKLIEKTQNTTPDTLELYSYMLKACNKCEFFVMEVSSHAIAQNRIAGIIFDTKVHTNITQDHLDFHKSIQEYRSIKNSFLNNARNIIVNIDDKYLTYSKNHTTYSINANADINATNINIEQDSINAKIKYKNEESHLKSKLLGAFNLSNILASIGVVMSSINISLESICKEIYKIEKIDGRMQVASNNPLIIVDFAHTPDGMQKVLEIFKNKKIIILFGAGGDRDSSKRELMGKTADMWAAKIYLTNDNPRFENEEKIIKQIKQGIKNTNKIQIIYDRKLAIKEAIKDVLTLKDGVLLVLGKGNEEYQNKNGISKKFSDMIQIKRYLKDIKIKR